MKKAQTPVDFEKLPAAERARIIAELQAKLERLKWAPGDRNVFFTEN